MVQQGRLICDGIGWRRASVVWPSCKLWCTCRTAQATLKQKESELSLVAPYSKSYGRTTISSILGAEDGGKSLVRAELRRQIVATAVPANACHVGPR